MKPEDFLQEEQNVSVGQEQEKLHNEVAFIVENREQLPPDSDELGELSYLVGFDDKGNALFNSVKGQKEGESNPLFKMEKGSNLLDTFIKNFKSSYKYYSKVNLYEVPGTTRAEQLEELFQDKRFANQAKVLNTAIPVESINWNKLEELGVSKDYLLKSGNLEKILNKDVSSVVNLRADIAGNMTDIQGKLYLKKEGDNYTIRVRPVLKDIPVNKPFFGYAFSSEEQTALLENGHLGHLAELKSGDTTFKAFVSVDKDTNQLVALNREYAHVPQKACGVVLSEEQKTTLSEGGTIRLDNLMSKSGKPYSADLTFSAETNSLDVKFDNSQSLKQAVSQSKTHKEGFREVPKVLQGVTLSDDVRKRLEKGDLVMIEGMTGKNGIKYDAYVSFNKRAKSYENPFTFNFEKGKEKDLVVSPHSQSNKQSQQQAPRHTKKNKNKLKVG